jgi:PAS domain S-box-containing protein
MQSQSVPLPDEDKFRLQAQLLNSVDQAIIATDLDGRIFFWNRFAETLYGLSADEALDRNIIEVTSGPTSITQDEEVMACLQRGESRSGEFLVQRRDGTTFTAYVTDSPILDEQGALIGIVGISRNISDEKQLQEANRLLAEVSALFIDAADYKAPLTTLAQLAIPQLADWCAVHLLQADGSIEQVALAPAELDAKQISKLQAAYDWLQNHLPKDDAAGLPAVLRTGESKLVTDVALDQWAAAAAIKSYMIVPLIARPQTLGAITFVAAESGRRFDLNALNLAENLVSNIAIYLDKARLYRESQQRNTELEQRVSERTIELQALAANLELAREEERTQVARELHDQLGQALTAMKFDLVWLTNQLERNDATLAQKSKTITVQMDAMIKTVRRIATELRPGMLDDLGLTASIEWQAQDFEKRTGIVCAVSVPDEPLPLNRAQSVALFRIFQEALTNVARHASAHHIEVKLVATPEGITLQVHDDGQGIPANKIAGLHSLGLLGMRERANRLGGTFDIQGVPDDGTMVMVSIPVEQSG